MCKEEFDAVWDHGPWFLNGKPFIFQKWNWDFRPTKVNFNIITLWIKMPNFSLCCWNEHEISKVSRKVGIPITVENLTASKSCLTFAPVRVQVSADYVLLDSVSLNLNGL